MSQPQRRAFVPQIHKPPNPALQQTVHAFGVALPSQRFALLGAAELGR